MRRLAKASPAAPIASTGTTRARKSLFGMACACVLGLVAFAGSGAPAAGAADEVCPNAQFRTGPGALLPECRAYEQVSPVNKNGTDIVFGAGSMPVAGSGGRAVFQALGEFAGATHGGHQGTSVYVGTRTSGGWATVSAFPRPEPVAAGADFLLSSSDLRRTVLTSNGVLASTPPDTTPEDRNFYLRDNDTNLTSPLDGLGGGLGNPVISPDLEHLVFNSNAVLTDDPGVPGTFESKVYEKVGNQPLRLVSVKPDGTPFPSSALTAGTTIFSGSGNPYSTVGGVSDDGSHIFFNTEGEIYRRSNGTITTLASPSKSTVPDPQGPQSKSFKFATADGNRVLFISAQQLTDDANTGPAREGADLYRYDFEADQLVDISATVGGNGAQVEGVVGFDEDAERVYYVAKGQVVSGEGTEGQPNLYLWEDDGTADGQTRFIATLVPDPNEFGNPHIGDSGNWFRLEGSWTARTSPDGRYLLFESEAAIPGWDNFGPSCFAEFNPELGAFTGYGPGICKEVYRYDADADGGNGELDCVSCPPEADTPIGPAFVTQSSRADTAQPWELPRALTADGRVFFTTPDGLLPQDTNSLKDAYMWKDGELHLLSTGSSNRDSFFYNASVDGKDAFIVTDEALVPQDGDDLADLYTAHVNGGFASQFATPPPDCSGEECRNAGTQPPGGQPPLTPSLQGPGNAASDPPKSRCPKGKRRVKARNGNSRCVKKKSAQRRGKQNRANDNRRASR